MEKAIRSNAVSSGGSLQRYKYLSSREHHRYACHTRRDCDRESAACRRKWRGIGQGFKDLRVTCTILPLDTCLPGCIWCFWRVRLVAPILQIKCQPAWRGSQTRHCLEVTDSHYHYRVHTLNSMYNARVKGQETLSRVRKLLRSVYKIRTSTKNYDNMWDHRPVWGL